MIVNEKQSIIKRAIITTKIKLEKVSKPRVFAKFSNGSGNKAMIINTTGSKSHATEFFTDMEFFLRQKIIIMSRINAAMLISICKLFIFCPLLMKLELIS